MNQLEQLKQFTTVVADTGDFRSTPALLATGFDNQSFPDSEGRRRKTPIMHSLKKRSGTTGTNQPKQSWIVCLLRSVSKF